MNNIKTFGFGMIDWTGFKSVIRHTAISALLTMVLALVQTLYHVDFGLAASFMLPVFVFVNSFLKKLAEKYSVTIPDSKVKVTENTGPVAPAE